MLWEQPGHKWVMRMDAWERAPRLTVMRHPPTDLGRSYTFEAVDTVGEEPAAKSATGRDPG